MIAADERFEDAGVAVLVRSDLKGRGGDARPCLRLCEGARIQASPLDGACRQSFRDRSRGGDGVHRAPCAEDMSLTVLTKLSGG